MFKNNKQKIGKLIKLLREADEPKEQDEIKQEIDYLEEEDIKKLLEELIKKEI